MNVTGCPWCGGWPHRVEECPSYHQWVELQGRLFRAMFRGGGCE